MNYLAAFHASKGGSELPQYIFRFHLGGELCPHNYQAMVVFIWNRLNETENFSANTPGLWQRNAGYESYFFKWLITVTS